MRYEKRKRFRDKFFKRIPPRSRVVHVDSCCFRTLGVLYLCEEVEAEGVWPFIGRSTAGVVGVVVVVVVIVVVVGAADDDTATDVETADDELGEVCLSD